MTLKPNHVHNSSEQPKWRFLLTASGVLTTIGIAVPVGYNIGALNSLYDYMVPWCNATIISRHDMHLTSEQLSNVWSTIISIFLIGGCVGSIFGATLADRFGRKKSLLMCGFLSTISAILFYLCRLFRSVELLLLGRIVVGLSAGLTTSVLPMYLSEIAPLELRGALGVCAGLGITGGVVIAQVVTLQEVLGTAGTWHIALAAYVILVFLCFIPYLWFPESPKYLFIVLGDRDHARYELIRLRGNRDMDRINKELELMEIEATTQSETRSILSVLGDKTLLMPIILVCVLQGGQQLSGVNAVFYYSVKIFESAGLSTANAKLANLGAGCVNLLTACFTPYIMGHYNRRPVILWSCFTSGIFLLSLAFVTYFVDAVSWFSVACVLSVFGYIFGFQIGLGSMPFFIASELFEISSRSAAMSLGSLSSWAGNFIVGMMFLNLLNAIGAFVFMPFAIVCFVMVILLYKYLPETRGKHGSDVVPQMAHGFKSKITK